MGHKQGDEPPGEPWEYTSDEELEREWNWVKERGQYVDGQIPPASEDELEKIRRRIQED